MTILSRTIGVLSARSISRWRLANAAEQQGIASAGHVLRWLRGERDTMSGTAEAILALAGRVVPGSGRGRPRKNIQKS